MQDIIRLLPESLANQIAAGEVVQRPASVVKELLENSLDAKSANIRLIVKDAGRTLIQVVDDGCGMSVTDARMCFERHATSKISRTDDLFTILTYGFRGEAMASIAAVAQVELKTKRAEDSMGTQLIIEGSEIKVHEPTSCPDGSSISVKNLFFNVPARRNFLKSNQVEFKHVLDEFQRVALANPEIGFSLYHNDTEIYNLKGGNLAKRIIGLFGKNYQDNLIACQENVQHVSVKGYIGKPEISKKTRGEQFFFVNNRFIKHGYLHHAVMEAFDSLLDTESYPFYALFIQIDPRHVDVNVHPTKTEVKFDDERTIYAVIRAAAKQSLVKFHVAPSIDFDIDANYDLPSTPQNNLARQQNFAPQQTVLQKNNQKNWDKLFDFHSEKFINEKPQISQQTETPIELTFSSSANETSSVTPSQNHFEPFQIHQSYIVSQVKSGLMLIDQEAAHERVLFERFLNDLENHSGASQRVMFPHTIHLNPTDLAILKELQEELKTLGFDFEFLGNQTIALNGIPAELANNTDEEKLLENLLEQYKQSKPEMSLPKNEKIAAAFATRAGIKKGKLLSISEMNFLIEDLFACPNHHFTPSGKKIIAMLNQEKVESLFS